jgi:predicted DNA binding CopG/RHH family protein
VSKQRAAKSRIPEFPSYQEEAEWWDNHDLADFLDEMTPVRIRFKKRSLSEDLNVPVDSQTLQKLRERAGELGIDPETLVRMWIREHLRGESPATSAPAPAPSRRSRAGRRVR